LLFGLFFLYFFLFDFNWLFRLRLWFSRFVGFFRLAIRIFNSKREGISHCIKVEFLFLKFLCLKTSLDGFEIGELRPKLLLGIERNNDWIAFFGFFLMLYSLLFFFSRCVFFRYLFFVGYFFL
jgi:hypothetical protein